MAQRLINEIPPHDVFVSAFLGDCAILRRKRPAELSIGIDLDRENVDRWALNHQDGAPFPAPLQLFCCDGIEWLRHRFGLYLVGSALTAAEAQAARSSGVGSCVAGPCDAADRLTRPRSRKRATAAAVAGNGGQYSVARNGGVAGEVAGNGGADVARSSDANTGASSLIGNGTAERACYFTADQRGGTGTVFVYVDPPYLMGTRSSKGRLYKHELDGERHVELLKTVRALPCLVMVSHYPCDVYDLALGDWRSFTFLSRTRGGRMATEKVWCNYPPPVELHDARFLGANKRQREKIRRRRNNLVARMRRMPPLERQALIAEALAAE